MKRPKKKPCAELLICLNTNLANQIASNDYRIYAITSATIAGNTDTSIIIDFAEVTSYEIMNPVAFIQGYEVSADWDTKLFIKQINFDFATKKMVINVRTQGSTTQTYLIAYNVFFQKKYI